MSGDRDINGLLDSVEAVYRDAKSMLDIIRKRATVEQTCYRFKAKILQHSQRLYTNLGQSPLTQKDLGGCVTFSVYSSSHGLGGPRSSTDTERLHAESGCKSKIDTIKNTYLDYISFDAHRHEKISTGLMENVIPKLEDALKRIEEGRRAAHARISEFKKVQKDVETTAKKVRQRHSWKEGIESLNNIA